MTVKKVYKRIGLILLAVILFIAGIMYCVNTFKNKGVDSRIVTTQEEYYAELMNRNKIKPDVTKQKNYVISNVFVMQYKTQTQIRFRLAYPIPFMNENIYRGTGFTIKDSTGNELTSMASTYSETCMGLNGINFTLILNETVYIPKSGERLFFVIWSSKGTEARDSYCEFEITIP